MSPLTREPAWSSSVSRASTGPLIVPFTTTWAAWTSPSTRACSEITSVPGWSGSAATLPRTAPSTRRPPLKKTLPSMRVVAPIRLSIRFCGLLSLRNMLASLSAQRRVLRHFRFHRAGLENAYLHAHHPGLGAHPERAVDPLEVLECQAEGRRIRLCLRRYLDHSTAAALRQIDHQLEPALELLAAARPRCEQQHPVAVFPWQRVGFYLEAQHGQRRCTRSLGGEHALEDRELLAQAHIFLLQRARLLRYLLLRRALDRNLAVGRVGDRAQALELSAQFGELAARGRELLLDLAAIESGEAPARVVHPGGERRRKREQHRDADPAQVPGHVRAHEHLRRGDAESLTQLPEAIRHRDRARELPRPGRCPSPLAGRTSGSCSAPPGRRRPS